MDRNDILEILRLKPNGHLYHREGQTVEFKEQFNFAGLADYSEILQLLLTIKVVI